VNEAIDSSGDGGWGVNLDGLYKTEDGGRQRKTEGVHCCVCLERLNVSRSHHKQNEIDRSQRKPSSILTNHKPEERVSVLFPLSSGFTAAFTMRKMSGLPDETAAAISTIHHSLQNGSFVFALANSRARGKGGEGERRRSGRAI
jgi:hypothetical protein